MKLIVVGDIHGRWNSANRIINHELDSSGLALSTGDLGTYEFTPQNGQRLAFCHGNHENFDYIAGLINRRDGNLMALAAGVILRLEDGTTITAFPGVFSPHWFERGGKLKYFSKEDLERALSLKDRIDILIAHEASTGVVTRNGRDLGKEHIDELVAHLKPRVLFFGHHHTFYDTARGTTRVIGMDYPRRSYIRLNTEDFSIEKAVATLYGRLGYRYEWETSTVKR